MVKVGICDDEKVFRDRLKELSERYLRWKNLDYRIIEYKSAKMYLEQAENVDILLLDVEMEGIDGIQLKECLQQDDKVRILFVTSHMESMSEAFGRNVYGFLSKPVEEKQFSRYMGRMIEDILDNEKVVIGCMNGEHVINIQDIFYFKAEGKYSCVKTVQEEFFCNVGLKQIEEQLEGKLFFRSHKSYLVNLRNISKVEGSICLKSGEKIPVARERKREMKEAYRDYIIQKAR